MLKRVIPSTHPRKKYTAIFDDGARVHFGGKGCGDFILYVKSHGPVIAHKKRLAYLKRHAAGGENWSNPRTAGALSRWLLWEYPNLTTAVRMYNSHFVSKKRHTR